MNERSERDSHALPETQMLLINRLCNQLEAGWQAGQQPALEEIVGDLSGTDLQLALRDLLPLEMEYRQKAGETVVLEDYTQRFPDADRDWLASLLYSTRVNLPTASSDAPLPEVLGDYQILGRIGGGGMGTVYKAVHLRMNRIVALKVLKAEIQQNVHLMQRFEREVRAAARLSHPNIVAALDAREQDGLHFLVTEFVDGHDLDITVRNRGPLSPAIAVDCVIQAARGLDYAHQQGVVHRDIKPANLLRDKNGIVKVLDMGLARFDTDLSLKATELTDSGMVLGTMAYMAPEQARDVRRADARSDIYSLGCTLYFLLTGRPAFTGETAIDILLSHINEPIPTLSSGPSDQGIADLRELQRIFSRMVAKDPDERFQSAAEVVAALEGLDLKSTTHQVRSKDLDINSSLDGTSTEILTVTAGKQSNPTVTLRTGWSATSRRRVLAGMGFLIVASIAVIIAMQLGDRRGRQPAMKTSLLAFDGETSYLSAPTLVPVAGETYTLEAFVAPDQREPLSRIGNVVSWLGPDWMALFFSNGKWGLARRVNEQSHLIALQQPAAVGVPVHLAGVCKGNNLALFINGQPLQHEPVEFNLGDTTGGLFIGGVPPEKLPADQKVRFFKGRIHSVRISRGARYTGSFDPPKLFQSDAQTLTLYQFHTRTDGSVVKDESGNGHDATIHAAAWIENTDHKGRGSP